MKLPSRGYQLLQVFSAISSIATGGWAVRSFLMHYESWLRFLLTFLAFCLVSMVFYIQAGRRGPVTAHGKERVSCTNCQHRVYYPKPFRHVPHLRIYSFHDSGRHRWVYYQNPPTLGYKILQQSPGYFDIELESNGGQWCFKWKAQGLPGEHRSRHGTE